MLPLSFLENEAKNIRYVISDVDDTITNGGRLLSEALAALYLIRDTGRKIILLTGGSAGWGDVYIRQWPVEAVVAESGALFLTRQNGSIIYTANPVIDEISQKKRKAFLESIPESILSSDQYARLYDIAIDKSKISEAEKASIIHNALNMGAYYAESSIHINIWLSNYDKWKGLKSFFEFYYGIKDESFINESMYLGDALNDQPLFKDIPISVGMKSVEDNKEEFAYLPKYIAKDYGGYGIKEVSKVLSCYPVNK